MQEEQFHESYADNQVDANKGTVTLSGTVDTNDMRMHAHQIAATTPGVTNVIDNLSVTNAGWGRRNP